MSLFYRILKQVEALYFSIDWNSHVGSGSTKFKRNFKRNTFIAQPHIAEQLENLDLTQINALLKGDLKIEFKAWVRKCESTITARNRLLEMYNLFGVSVLLDPVWSVDTLAAHPNGKFPRLYRAVAQHLASKHARSSGLRPTSRRPLLASLHRQALDVLLTLLSTVGNRDDTAHIRAFLADHPPTNIVGL